MKGPSAPHPGATPRRFIGQIGVWLGAGALAAAALWGLQSRRAALHPERDAAAPPVPELVVARESPGAATPNDVTLASLQRAVLSQLAERNASPSAAVPDDPQRPLLATLDQRLANAPRDPAETARLHSELRAILDSGLLEGAAATLACASSMCRIDISDADDARAQKATNVVAGRLPKAFAAAAVYSKGTGERAIYAAKDGADLRLGEVDPAHAAASAEYESESK